MVGESVGVQVFAPSDDVKIGPVMGPLATPPMLAAKRSPFAEEAIELQAAAGAKVVAQVIPESVEERMEPGMGEILSPMQMANLVPSAEDAIDGGHPTRCWVCVQVLPPSIETKTGP